MRKNQCLITTQGACFAFKLRRRPRPSRAAARSRSGTKNANGGACMQVVYTRRGYRTPRGGVPAAPPAFAMRWSTRQARSRRTAADLLVSARGGSRLSATTATTTFTKRQRKSQPKPSRRRSREFPSQVRPRRPLGRPVEEDAGRQEEERTIPASRGAAAPSRHRRDSYPSDEVVGGFFSILRPFGPRRATAMPRAGRRQQAQVPQGRGPGRRRQGVPRGSREEADFLPRRRRQQPRLRHGPQVGQGQVRRVHEGGLRRVARQGRQEAAEPDVLSARCARRPLTYDLSNI